MNRRLSWSQAPPDFHDYDPNFFQGPAQGPLQQAPMPSLEDGSLDKSESPETKVVVVPKKKSQKVPPPQENVAEGEGGGLSHRTTFAVYMHA